MGKAAVIFAAIIGALSLSVASAQPATNPLAPKTATAEAKIPAPPVTPANQNQPIPTLNAQDVNAWLDGYMPLAIGRAGIPGAVVTIVKDGQILTARGYGYADLSAHKRVDPATTLFRPGSISKLFVWTAMMQLVEQGKVDLDGDVNQYLDFKIPPYQGKPITVRQLMTHTAGFEEQVKDIITNNPKAAVEFETLLHRWTPKRVYAPGSTPAYSNWGNSLTAYIVQRVSGIPFEAYIERNIFQPLGMNHSSFRQPLPANLKPLASEGYVPGRDKPYGFEFVGPSPAGALSSTGTDMGRFMIAHLQGGQFNRASILKPATAALMHSAANRPIPGLNAMALGFYQTDINGMPVVAHGGDTVAFHSDLHLFLDKGVGLFVSFNSPGKNGAAQPLRNTLFEEFADRYFPSTQPPAPAIDAKTARENAQKLAGVYANSRGSKSNFIAITELLGQAKVAVDKDGNPSIPSLKGLSGEPEKWIAIGPMLWRSADGHNKLGAIVEDGQAVRFSTNELAPIMVWDRVPAYRNSAWILPLLYFSLGALALTALLWPTRAIVRKRFGAALAMQKTVLRPYRWSRISAVAILAVLIGWVVVMQSLFSDLSNLGSGFTAILIAIQLLSIVVFIGGFGVMLWYAYTAWKAGLRWTAKTWSIVLVIASATVLYVALVFKLIGLATNF